ncbi:hypothetical protein [Halomonas elongata]|uniref:YfhG lipoprotein n=1 Tax=Halomonas elongata (strain ATCC 33173 / DSM 2581 / NBRC 15536 / NCIMB 2198 / 1H9) TaxID=768066 RepID=E1V7F3_HALED|nr:hypothetical protein [Halomonas elongata]MBW5801322.1 hypothetical protein [Halomonas elongata]RAW06306.1 hypothetical protein DKQ62_14695 [Halomonas elongata]WBF18737.1 hypothetical protein LM502_03260 [Halomonas elongata]WPU47593.1 hypothetical protein SR933_01485 [Halomonas elongata DSM 2581]WVI72262.1 hypothetical protein VO226_03080 [Halomonas elongata]
MNARALIVCLAAAWLAGCQWLPEQSRTTTTAGVDAVAKDEIESCYAEVPGFADDACLLHDWVAFGLASQRGDDEWRARMRERLAGSRTEARLARAVVLSWGPPSQWKQASELFKADLHAAPPRLQPLLRYWLNEIERRRDQQGRLTDSEQARTALVEEKEALTQKLDALTDIERNINSRQRTE